MSVEKVSRAVVLNIWTKQEYGVHPHVNLESKLSIPMSRRQFQRQPNVGIGVKSISSPEADSPLNLSKRYLHSHSMILKMYQPNKPPYLAPWYGSTKSVAFSNLFFVALLIDWNLNFSPFQKKCPIVQSERSITRGPDMLACWRSQQQEIKDQCEGAILTSAPLAAKIYILSPEQLLFNWLQHCRLTLWKYLVELTNSIR